MNKKNGNKTYYETTIGTVQYWHMTKQINGTQKGPGIDINVCDNLVYL